MFEESRRFLTEGIFCWLFFFFFFYNIKLKTKGGPDGSSPSRSPRSMNRSFPSRRGPAGPACSLTLCVGQVWNGTAVQPQRNHTDMCAYLYIFEIHIFFSSFERSQLYLHGRWDGFSRCSRGRAGRRRLAPSIGPSSNAAFGVSGPCDVRSGTPCQAGFGGDLCAKRKHKASCHQYLQGSKMLIEASSRWTGAERGARLCAENRVFPLQTIRASKPLSVFKGTIFMSGL